ncbi:MAG: hypothetical protein H0V61_07880 [Chitinophagales bacterium]|nr:hypothetical protein [Chitinophagales bacterium]
MKKASNPVDPEVVNHQGIPVIPKRVVVQRAALKSRAPGIKGIMMRVLPRKEVTAVPVVLEVQEIKNSLII